MVMVGLRAKRLHLIISIPKFVVPWQKAMPPAHSLFRPRASWAQIEFRGFVGSGFVSVVEDQPPPMT